jgi:hypothetical protein
LTTGAWSCSCVSDCCWPAPSPGQAKRPWCKRRAASVHEYLQAIRAAIGEQVRVMGARAAKDCDHACQCGVGCEFRQF